MSVRIAVVVPTRERHMIGKSLEVECCFQQESFGRLARLRKRVEAGVGSQPQLNGSHLAVVLEPFVPVLPERDRFLRPDERQRQRAQEPALAGAVVAEDHVPAGAGIGGFPFQRPDRAHVV